MILDAFQAAMAAEGYDATTVTKVAEGASLDRSSIYRHFPDKTSLLLALSSRETDRFVAALQPILGILPDAPSKLNAIVHAQILHLADTPHGGLSDVLPLLNMEARLLLLETIQPLHDLLAAVVSQGISEGSLASDLHVEATTAVILDLLDACRARTIRPGAQTEVAGVLSRMLEGLRRGARPAPGRP